MFIPENLEDAAAKDDFANTGRLMCIAHAATVAVMALEAWAKSAKPGEKFNMTELPSEAFDRREVDVLMGEAAGVHKQKFLPIIRTDAGGFFGFGEANGSGTDKIQGRFAQLLPTKIPDAAMRDLAKVMLKVKGAGRAKAGITPRAARPRRF